MSMSCATVSENFSQGDGAGFPLCTDGESEPTRKREGQPGLLGCTCVSLKGPGCGQKVKRDSFTHKL